MFLLRFMDLVVTIQPDIWTVEDFLNYLRKENLVEPMRRMQGEVY